MNFTYRDMQVCIRHFNEIVFPRILHAGRFYPNFHVNHVAGCNFAIVSFGGVGVYGCAKYDKIHVSVDPFRPGNQVTNFIAPFFPRVITGRLMLNGQFTNVELNWAATEDMGRAVEGLIRRTSQENINGMCAVM